MRLIILFSLFMFNATASDLRSFYTKCEVSKKSFFEDSRKIAKESPNDELVAIVHPDLIAKNLEASEFGLLCGSLLFEYKYSKDKETLDEWRSCVKDDAENVKREDIDLVYLCLKKI